MFDYQEPWSSGSCPLRNAQTRFHNPERECWMTYTSQKAIPNLEANLMNDCDFVLCHLLVRFCRQRFLLDKTDLKELSMSSVSYLSLSRWWIQFLVYIFKSNLYLAWLPTDYGVLTRLGEDEVAKPATTVHIVSEYIMEITFKSRVNRDQGQQSTYFL